MTSRTSPVSRRAPLSVRVTAVLLLGIVTVASPSLSAAQGPAKGTEILWDRYGVPHIFAPDHASLFYAYGYAQMEAHSELLLRLYAQARGRVVEGGTGGPVVDALTSQLDGECPARQAAPAPPLLDPVAGEGGVVDQADLGEPVE